MKIRLKVEGSGPDGMVQPGEEIEVGEETGRELVEAGKADLVEEAAPVDAVDEGELVEEATDEEEIVEEEPAGLGGLETE